MTPPLSNAASLALACFATSISPGASLGLSGTSTFVTRRVARLRDNSSSIQQVLAVDAKPIRIIRGGDGGADPKEHKPGHQDDHKCGTTLKVNSASDKWEYCPDACPYYVQDRTDSDFCTFACVAASECAKFHPETPIGDKDLGVCRSCVVEGCAECDHSAAEDRCSKCQAGFRLESDGLCYFKYGGAWTTYVLYGILALVGVVVIWVLDMACRPTYNESGLEHASTFREKILLRMPKDDNGERKLWPLSTNLLTAQVAGPGMSLHFNFQAAVIVWAVFVAVVWMCLAGFIDPALWILGTRAFGTPRSNCILVAWGYETQQRLMWTKVLFLWVVYIGSILMAFGYGIYQLRAFQDIDYQHKTMKDFVGMVVGMPRISGDKPVEKDLKDHIERLTSAKVVGVSVAWDYQEHEETVDKALSDDLKALEDAVAKPALPETPAMNPVRGAFRNLEKVCFGIPGEDESDAEAEEKTEDPIDQLVTSLHTSPRAFVVFETQEERDRAMEAIGEGFAFEGALGLTMEEITAEPDTVQWVNFGHSTLREKALKLLAGFGIIGLACFFWAVVFYSPYAYYVLTFNYENGRQPGFAIGMAFSLIVCVGNVIMYEVCARISDWVGFRFKDDKEACYMILYTVACMFNVALDFVTTYMTAEMVMEGLGFRTYFGVPFRDVPTFTEKFETYGMQRSLAENTYSYAFPSTFLIPFLIEPLPAIFVPLWLGRWVVKGHPEVQGRLAEEWLTPAPMEMGRYADLLLNMILGVLIFYFPGGFTWKLFLGMAGSHVYIYAFDHWRVLRGIPACVFASYDIEWYCQAMLAPIIGVMASCLVFKSNCEPGAMCLQGFPLIFSCCVAWVLHVVAHLAVLTYVVPRFGKPAPEVDPCAGMKFEDLARKVPCSWFTSNPIHCLRSKHHYSQSPPCSFYTLGKENFMQVNEGIGCFYMESSSKK